MKDIIVMVSAIVIVLGISLIGTAYYIDKISKPMQKGIECLVYSPACNR